MYQRNYTHGDLADKIGITPSNISCIITGKSDPCVDTLYCIAVELEVSCDYLLGLSDNIYGGIR